MNSVTAIAKPEPITDGLGPMARWVRDRDDPATVSVIVQRVAEGERLKVICRSRGWPYSLVAQWVAETDGVGKAYEQALRLAADDLATETVEIADGATPEDVAVSKHRTDVRLKLAGKLYQDRYGEKVQVNHALDPFGEMLRRVSERKLAQMKASQMPEQTPERVVERVVEGEVIAEPVSTDAEI